MSKPTLLITVGIPGSGKTTFCQRFCAEQKLFHLNADRLRLEMIDQPTYEPDEHRRVFRTAGFIADELLSREMSLIYDANFNRQFHRQKQRALAQANGAEFLILWFQIDPNLAWSRIGSRSSRVDDKYYRPIDREVFDRFEQELEQPSDEPYVALTGEAAYEVQRELVLKQLGW